MCRQFSCLPSQLEEEDAGLLRLLRIEELGSREQDEAVPEGGDWDG